jgi:hypothetical protein
MRSSPAFSCFRATMEIPCRERRDAFAWALSAPRSPITTGSQIARTAPSRAALMEISGPMPPGSPAAMAIRGFITARV